MEKSNTYWDKLFLGFGVLTVISGIFLIIEEDYVIGISGSIVGIFLLFLNTKQIKDTNNE